MELITKLSTHADDFAFIARDWYIGEEISCTRDLAEELMGHRRQVGDMSWFEFDNIYLRFQWIAVPTRDIAVLKIVEERWP